MSRECREADPPYRQRFSRSGSHCWYKSSSSERLTRTQSNVFSQTAAAVCSGTAQHTGCRWPGSVLRRARAMRRHCLWRCQAADACTVACYLVSCTRTFCQCPQQAPEPVLVVCIDLSPGEGMESAIRSADGAGAGATASGGRCTRAVHGCRSFHVKRVCLPANKDRTHLVCSARMVHSSRFTG